MFKLTKLKCMGFKRLRISEEIFFPEGRMLIYGRNESGKSTIMEAIHYCLYGLALRPSKNASNDDLINYGYPEAIVELTFTIDDNEYIVKRIIKRRGTNTHELIIHRLNGERERITGAREVNNLILEELHGIDSEALLNSCLVEQKELGKLEDSVRAKRIEAMTSLLNIDAFVDAQQDLKQSTRELEADNQETVYKLEKSEQAKNDYEEAENKLGRVQNRIMEILSELEEVEKKIKELTNILKIIDIIKEIKRNIEKKTIQVNGLNGELRRIEINLKEAEEAAEQVKQIKEELPAARLNFEDKDALYKTLEKLLNLENQLKNAREELKRAKERLEEADKKVEESEKASQQVDNLNNRISVYEKARKAQNILPNIEASYYDILKTKTEIERLKQDESDLKSKLSTLQESERKIEQLLLEENQLESLKTTASHRRSLGIVSLFLGLVSLFGYSFSQYFIPIGVGILILGGIMVLRSSPNIYDPRISEIRKEREILLGDKSRISEYQQTLEYNSTQLSENENRLTEAEVSLNSSLYMLPSSPNEYASIINVGTDLKSSINSLRELVYEDLQTLTKLTTERNVKKDISDKLEERELRRNEENELLEVQMSEIQLLQQKFDSLVEKNGIDTEDADSIKNERDEAQKNVQKLKSNLEIYQRKASQFEKLSSELNKVQESIDYFENEIKILDEEKEQLISYNGVDLTQENTLRIQNEDLRQRSASLRTEKNERESDVEESKHIMDETFELKEEYPKLVEKNIEEGFDLESMRRAIILLDTTRDGIMGGVKKRIESHMVHFLPALTDQRYNMVRIDEKDYRIEVYDREAKRWRGKGVFSGATQDQLSLALRLAFALSTIPSTRGARPGFIFLDEPLSGFDVQRREGFMHLLEVELPKYFSQIIVISHLEQLQEEFPNHLQLEAGHVIH